MKSNAHKPIGIFDSGLGGLTVLREIMRLMPNEDIIYFGDSKRAPYGTKSKETITNFAFQDVSFLMEQGVKSIVVACNTVSSNSIEELRKGINVPVFEVIGPGARAGASAAVGRKVAVIGTEATISSGAYKKKLLQENPGLDILQKSCPLFVPIAEEGSHMWNSEIARLAAEMYLGEIREYGADVLILGCTHYPLLKDVISDVMGNDTVIVDSAKSVAAELKKMHEGARNHKSRGIVEIYTSDSREKFLPLSREILETEDITVNSVDIEKF